MNYLYRYTRTQKDFTPEIIYPYKNLLTSSDIVEYQPTKNKNTIHRRFKRREQDISTETVDIWKIASEKYQGLSLAELLIRNENLILLESKAGMGKTVTLSDMYYFLLDDTQYFPLFLKLRSSTLEKIKEYLEYIRNNFINNKIPFLLLDGLDEFPSDKVSELIREISSTIQGEPEAKILVTTRENAIASENDFISYELSPFTVENMKEFAKNENISDIASFIECIEKKDLMELAIIPFYLKLMSKIFFETHTLTTKDKLIDQVISLRLQEEISPSILENQYKIEEGLKDLALFLQACKCFMLDNRSYTRLFDSDIRGYFQDSNLIVRKKESGFIYWEFEHNIFREYLVASVLTTMPLEEIVGLVTVKEGTILRGSYEKILEIFLLTDKSEEFTQFLLAEIPLSLATVNAINLTEEQKFEVARYFISENPYENQNYDDYEKFAHYYSSKKVMDYYVACIDTLEDMELLNRILGILYHSDHFYGMESMLFDEIIQIYRTEHWEYLRYRAMYALRSILRYGEFKDLDKLMLITTEDDYNWNTDMTASIIPILSDSSSCDEYCDFILKYIETPVNNGVTHLHTSYLETILRKISNPDNLIMLTSALRKTSAKPTYGKNDLFETALDEWNRFYERTCDKMYPALVKELCEASQDMDHYGLNKLISFVETKKPVERWLFDVVKSVDSGAKDAWFLNHFAKEQYVDTILHCYRENYISSENLTRYSKNFTTESKSFLKIKVALLEKDNITLSNEIPQTYEEQKREVAQKFFDLMFPPEQLEELLKELVSLYPEDALCSEWDMEYLPEENPQFELLKYLKDVLFKWYYHHKGDATTKLRDAILDEDFLNYQKYQILKEDSNLIITDEQREWYRIYFETLLKNFDNSEVNEGNYQKLRSEADILLFLAHHFHFQIKDDILGFMLYLTPIVLKEPFRGCYSSGYEVIEVLVQEKESFQKAVLRNLEGEQEMLPDAVDTHLIYCKNNLLSEGIP